MVSKKTQKKATEVREASVLGKDRARGDKIKAAVMPRISKALSKTTITVRAKPLGAIRRSKAKKKASRTRVTRKTINRTPAINPIKMQEKS